MGGLETGGNDRDFEPILPAPVDTRTAEDLFPDYGLEYENAWAGSECEIEGAFNAFRRENEMEELHDPDCNTEGLEEELEIKFDQTS